VEHVVLFCVSDVTLQLRIHRVVPIAVLSSRMRARCVPGLQAKPGRALWRLQVRGLERPNRRRRGGT
jgi:hypothetical protein